LKIKLKGHHFDNIEVIEAESQAVLNFQDACRKWKKCWEQCIHVEGNYLSVIVANRLEVRCFFFFYQIVAPVLEIMDDPLHTLPDIVEHSKNTNEKLKWKAVCSICSLLCAYRTQQIKFMHINAQKFDGVVTLNPAVLIDFINFVILLGIHLRRKYFENPIHR
jgi:hypothetical protein